jgi:hypothetical protein
MEVEHRTSMLRLVQRSLAHEALLEQAISLAQARRGLKSVAGENFISVITAK